MGIAAQILGHPGTGKTFSMYKLKPNETYYINSDAKPMPFRGWRSVYNTDARNYMKTSDPAMIARLLIGISDKRPDIKQVLVDTVNSVMSDKEMAERKKPGFDKWADLAGDIYDLYVLTNSDRIREDLVVVFVGHIEPYQDSFETKWRLKTNGQKLTNLNIEGKVSYTFYTDVENKGEGDITYSFTTQNSGSDTARSPYQLFEYKIPNDLNFIINSIRDYENGEFEFKTE